MSDADLLRRRIRESGMTNSDFARDVLFRDPRQVRRWLAGTSKLPAQVREFLTTRAPRGQPQA